MSIGNQQRKTQLGRPKCRWFNIIVAVIRSRTDSRGVDVIFAARTIHLAHLQSGQFDSEAHSAFYVASTKYMLFHLRYKNWGMKPPPSVEVRISGVKLPFPYTFIVRTRTFSLETLKAMEMSKLIDAFFK